MDFRIPTSRRSRSRAGAAARGAWIFLCVLPLFFYLLHRQPEPHDAVEVFGWMMLMLAFPVGFVVFALVGGLVTGLHAWLGVEVPAAVQVLALWIGAGTAGYAQWFHLLPRMWRREASGDSLRQAGAVGETQKGGPPCE